MCIRGWIRDAVLSRELSLLGTCTVCLLLDYDCVLSKQRLELARFSKYSVVIAGLCVFRAEKKTELAEDFLVVFVPCVCGCIVY